MTVPGLVTAFPDDAAREAGVAALRALDATPTAIESVPRGNRKRTAIARFDDRDDVAVQVCPEGEWLRTETALLRAIRGRTGVPVPSVLAAGDHGGVAYLVTGYVSGEDLHDRFTSLEGGTQRALARWFGGVLGQLHAAFTFDGYGPLGLVDDTLTATHDDWHRWFEGYATRAIGRLPGAFDDLRPSLHAAVADRPTTSPRARLFPWDFRPGNALIADGAVAAVVDWEAPLAAAPALSVAKAEYLVADWYVDDADPLRHAFREGYAEGRPYPTVHPAHRVVAIAESAVDSTGTVTNPGYPPVDESAAVAFHRDALSAAVDCMGDSSRSFG